MRGFTLIELMVVIAIMGLLGTVSVGGYRQMQRGMEQRGVLENVDSFMRAAYDRAQIDRQRTYVYFWNELVQEEEDSDEGSKKVVGHAVAVRARGRLTRVATKLYIDEFGDLEQYKESDRTENDPETGLTRRVVEYAEKKDFDTVVRLYQLDGSSEDQGARYSLVQETPVTPTGSKNSGQRGIFITYDPNDDSLDKSSDKGVIIQFGYEESTTAATGAQKPSWKVGSLYGFEFQSLDLPHGYIFETDVPTGLSQPVKDVNKCVICEPSIGNQTGKAGTVRLYHLRQGKSGSDAKVLIGTSTDPSRNR